jgi:glycosyltransferase involved in cell wall biosynthesis
VTVRPAPLTLKNRVLIVSSWAPPSLGGPQNLYNLFSRLDGASYAIFTSVANVMQGSAQMGSSLPCRYYFYDEEKRDARHCTKPGAPVLRALKWIRQGVALPLRIVRIVRRGLRVIKDEDIDLLLGISDAGPALLLTMILSRFSGKPYLLYFYDLYKGNDDPQPWKVIASLMEPALFQGARRVIVTNEKTKQVYERRYTPSRPVDVVPNSVDGASYENLRTEYAPKPPYHIVFTGRIYWPQERSVRNLIRAVIEMEDLDIRCTVYCPNTPAGLVAEYAHSPRVVFDVAPHAEMPGIQSQADILYLPLSWNTKSPAIISTASPGKLTDYLIAGRPILIHAPEDAYISQYARAHMFAHVVDREDGALLKAGIRKLLYDTDYAKRLITNARNVFYRYHDAAPNAHKMAAILNGA